MVNDTPGAGAGDSHTPLTSDGNGVGNDGVAKDMDEQTPPEHDAEATDPKDTASPEQPTTAEGVFDETDELAPVESPPVPQADVAGQNPFDYDTYYGTESAVRPPSDPAVTHATPAAAAAAAPTKKSRDGVMFFTGALAAAIIGAALTVGILASIGAFNSDSNEAALTVLPSDEISQVTTAVATPIVTNQIINELGASVNPTAVAVKTIPSIVTVTSLESTPSEDGDVFTPTGSGSGVVIDAAGYIVTNHHVADGAGVYRVTFEDGRVYEAELVGSDDLTDLAVLKISADDLVPIEFGSTETLHIGDPAVAVGNPLGQDGGSSVSVGIVSAFDRRVDFGEGDSLFGMIQTDAAINSGSSGGALVNASGELIGITAAIGVSTAGPEGIGYAIPVELVERISSEIIETGDVAHPFLGVTINSFIEEQPDGALMPAGAEIYTVDDPDSAAGLAGLEPGDVVIKIGDADIATQNDLILAVRLHRVGDEVEFVAIRNGEPQTFLVIMGQRPSDLRG